MPKHGHRGHGGGGHKKSGRGHGRGGARLKPTPKRSAASKRPASPKRAPAPKGPAARTPAPKRTPTSKPAPAPEPTATGRQPSGVKPPQKFDVDGAVAKLNAISSSKSGKHCARAVGDALTAGGLKFTRTKAAKDYGGALKKAGFKEVPKSGYRPERGDVVVIQSYKGGSPEGHIAMWNGKQWISDFRQNSKLTKDDPFGVYLGEGYRKNRPDYGFYRSD